MGGGFPAKKWLTSHPTKRAQENFCFWGCVEIVAHTKRYVQIVGLVAIVLVLPSY